MAPGRAATRSATSRWTIRMQRSGRGSAPRSRCRTGLVTWYGRFATTSNGGTNSPHRSASRMSAATSRSEPGGFGAGGPGPSVAAAISGPNAAARCSTIPRSSSTAVTAAPACRRPPVRIPSPGPISRTVRPGDAAAVSRIASSTSTSTRKFWLKRRWGRRPAARSVRRTAPGSSRIVLIGRRRATPSLPACPRRRARRRAPPRRRAPRLPAGAAGAPRSLRPGGPGATPAGPRGRCRPAPRS